VSDVVTREQHRKRVQDSKAFAEQLDTTTLTFQGQPAGWLALHFTVS
jgi:hypothetical protein